MTDNSKIIKALNRILDERFEGINNWLPAKIVKYDTDKKRADVKPLINFSDGGGDFLAMPIIPLVPVMDLSCSLFSFKVPYQEGDIVRVIFTNAGVDNFEGIQADETVESRGSLTNCFAIPSEYSNNDNSFEVTKEGKLIIKMKKSITLEANSVKILSNISEQFGKVITILQALSGNVVSVPAFNTPTPLTIASALSSTASQMQILKQQLDQVI
jgi:hypothetical protein